MRLENRKARVCFVVHSLDPGGAERLVADMAATLKQRLDVSVVCLDRPGAWATEVRRGGVPVHCLNRQPGVDPRIGLRLAQFSRAQGIDLLHAHQYTPWFYAGLSRVFAPRPILLFQEHGRHHPEVRSRWRELFNRCVLLPRTDCIVAVSRDIGQRLVRFEGLPTKRIRVIQNGAHTCESVTAEERTSLRAGFGFSAQDFVVGSVGRFDPIKNLPLLLSALSTGRKRQPNLRALLVGDGPCLPAIKEMVRQLGLAESVVTPGFRADAARLVGICDLFALTSFSEGSSVALLESMAAGVPALVTAVGGNPEIVSDGETGWIVPSDDPRTLTAALLDAVQNPTDSRRRGSAARRRFETTFTFSNMIGTYEALYREVLSVH